MVQFIDLPPNPQRTRTSSLVGQAIGENFGHAFSDASNMMLQQKMKDMYAEKDRQLIQKQQEQSAHGIASLFPSMPKQQRMEMIAGLSGMPLQIQQAALKPLMENYGSSNVIGNIVGGIPRSSLYGPQQGQQTEEPVFQQAAPTPSNISANLSAAQRMGIQMPGYPQQNGAAQPFQPLQNQYQPAIDEMSAQQGQPIQQQNQPRVMPSGQISPQLPPDQTPPLPQTPPNTPAYENMPAEEETVDIGDLSKQELNQFLNTVPKQKDKKAYLDAWENADKRKLEERKVVAKEKALIRNLNNDEIKREDNRTKSIRELEQKDVGTFISSARTRAAQASDQEAILRQIESSVQAGDLSWDRIADLAEQSKYIPSGLANILRTAHGASLNSGVKSYLYGDVIGLGSRNNQFMDKQISSVMPNVGKSKEADLGWVEFEKMKLNLAKAPQMFIEELKPLHLDDNGYPKESLMDDVNKHMESYARELQERTAFKTQQISEMNATRGDLLSTKPVTYTYLTPKRRDEILRAAGGDVDKAMSVIKKLGYAIPKKDWLENNNG